MSLVLAESLSAVPEALAAFEPELVAPQCLRFHYRTSASPVSEILGRAAEAGLTVVDVTTEETDLEDIFLQLTRGAHDGGEGSATD